MPAVTSPVKQILYGLVTRGPIPLVLTLVGIDSAWSLLERMYYEYRRRNLRRAATACDNYLAYK